MYALVSVVNCLVRCHVSSCVYMFNKLKYQLKLKMMLLKVHLFRDGILTRYVSETVDIFTNTIFFWFELLTCVRAYSVSTCEYMHTRCV
jgi:hypothetical protein